MYLNCCSEKAAEKQRRLEQCILELLQTELYDNISVSQLCSLTGVSRKTFYRLFDGKADVLYALIDHTLMDFEHYVPDPSVGPGGIHRFLAFCRDNRALLTALDTNNIRALLTERSLLLILAEDKATMELFGVAGQEYANDMMLFYVSGIFALVQAWHSSGYQRSIDEMSDLLNFLMQKSPLEPYNR